MTGGPTTVMVGGKTLPFEEPMRAVRWLLRHCCTAAEIEQLKVNDLARIQRHVADDELPDDHPAKRKAVPA